MSAFQLVSASVAALSFSASTILWLLLRRDRDRLFGSKLPFSSELDSNYAYMDPRNFSAKGRRLVYWFWLAQAILLVSAIAFLSTIN